jgi:2Fe-2S ferredoxin
MASITITFVQQDGAEKAVAAEAGESLMEAARAAGVEGILGDCGGGCACATCHVYVDPGWIAVVGAPDDVEEMTLDMASDPRPGSSRLCCQIRARAELEGLRVEVAPAV